MLHYKTIQVPARYYKKKKKPFKYLSFYNYGSNVISVLIKLTFYFPFPAEFFLKCKKSDPQIEKCILDGIESMKPILKTGIPEFNIPGLDPFTVPRLKLNRTAPNLRIKATIKQATAYGGSNFKVEKLR